MTLPLPVMDPCYLCEIVAQPASWNLVERTDLAVTVLNGRQFETGQCLVLPRRHAPTLVDLTEAEGAAVMVEEVPHFHMHVVPRTATSDWGFGPPHLARLEKSSRPAHIDHTVVTEGKVGTVQVLRQHLQ